MEEQRAQSQAAQGTVDLTAGNVLAEVADRLGGQSTEFLGYSNLSSAARVAAIPRPYRAIFSVLAVRCPGRGAAGHSGLSPTAQRSLL